MTLDELNETIPVKVEAPVTHPGHARASAYRDLEQSKMVCSTWLRTGVTCFNAEDPSGWCDNCVQRWTHILQ